MKQYQTDMFGSVTMLGKKVFTRQFNGRAYIAIRQLVSAVGLAWKPQFLAIKRRYASEVRNLPFQDSDGRYKRMLAFPLGEVNEWALSVNKSKVAAPSTLRNLELLLEDLDAAALAESIKTITQVRVAKLGEIYADFPLTKAEQKLLGDMRAYGREISSFGVFLGYRFVADAAKRELDATSGLNPS
ncbi:phage antirepressor N-terminal domain-containing protein [Ensifer adhaerens]|uniref:phage antirepressor N-terminal domain-containing protein n=1 Tax=Ensifer adhaerens TaxID=106592 RepID=UPI000DC3F7FE|nr:phage antirepressor N-terminal domain-containing protein [Ensifer adhaerens]RAS18289.1 P22-like antirepressor protein [Ensifer adhaerens]